MDARLPKRMSDRAFWWSIFITYEATALLAFLGGFLAGKLQ